MCADESTITNQFKLKPNQMNKIESLIEVIQPKLDLTEAKVEKKKDNWFNLIYPQGTSIIVVEAMVERINKMSETEPVFEGIVCDKFQFSDGAWYVMIVS